MKPFAISRTTLLCWTPLIVLGIFLGLSSALRESSPLLFCAPIDAGSKELVCGFEYSASMVQTVTIFSSILYFGALVLSAGEAMNRTLSKAGGIGFALSLLIVLAGFVLRSQFGSGDAP